MMARVKDPSEWKAEHLEELRHPIHRITDLEIDLRKLSKETR